MIVVKFESCILRMTDEELKAACLFFVYDSAGSPGIQEAFAFIKSECTRRNRRDIIVEAEAALEEYTTLWKSYLVRNEPN